MSGGPVPTPAEAAPAVRERPRVALISDAISGRNGVGSYYDDLASHLRDHLAHAELICPGSDPARDVEGAALPLPGDPTQRLVLPRPRRLSRRLKRMRPDVIIVATPGPYGLAALLWARRRGVPLCAGHHTRYEALGELYWGRAMQAVARTVLRTVNRLVFRRSRAVVANSDEMIADALRVGATDTRRIGTPLGRPFLETPPTTLPQPLDSVCYAGRLAREKGVDRLLEAARRLPDIRFTVAGDGPQRTAVERAAGKLANLRWLGWLPRESVRDVIDRSSLLLLPSDEEAFGTIALEAMARQRLVLVSPHCGLLRWSELVDVAYSIRSDESLSSAIARLAADPPPARADVARRARQQALAFHEHSTLQWLELLDASSGWPGSGATRLP